VRLAAGKRRCGKGRDWDMLFLLLWLVWSLPCDRAGHVPLLLKDSRIVRDEGGGEQAKLFLQLLLLLLSLFQLLLQLLLTLPLLPLMPPSSGHGCCP